MLSTSHLVASATAVFLSSLTNAQSTVTSLNPSICHSGSPLTTFSACNNLYSSINYCAGPSVPSGDPTIECFCNQQVFDGYYNCESEQRLCYLGDDVDADISSGIAVWHSACDSHLSFTPTTPPVSTLSVTYDADYCGVTVKSACNAAEMSQANCNAQYKGNAFSSCFCQPEILSQQYTCLYLGNVSCIETDAALTSIAAYSYCKNAPSVLDSLTGNMPSTNTASTTSLPGSTLLSSVAGGGAQSSPGPTTKPALPGSSTTTTGPSSTSSSSASLNSKTTYSDLFLLLAGFILVGVL